MKSYDVELDHGFNINIMLPESVDVGTPEGQRTLYDLIVNKIRDLLLADDISFVWKRCPEGDTQEEDDPVDPAPHAPGPDRKTKEDATDKNKVRTERVVLEITHDGTWSHPASWPWFNSSFIAWVRSRRGELVRVFTETQT